MNDPAEEPVANRPRGREEDEKCGAPHIFTRGGLQTKSGRRRTFLFGRKADWLRASLPGHSWPGNSGSLLAAAHDACTAPTTATAAEAASPTSPAKVSATAHASEVCGKDFPDAHFVLQLNVLGTLCV